MCVDAEYVLMHMCATRDAWGGGLEMPKMCTVCARHGIKAQNGLNPSKACEVSSNKINSSKGTHLSPIQPKNVTWTFCQTLNMHQNINTMRNA